MVAGNNVALASRVHRALPIPPHALIAALLVSGCLNWGVEEPAVDADTRPDADADQDGDIDEQRDTGTDGDADGDADGDVDRDAELDGDADVDGDARVDADADRGDGGDGDLAADAELDSDSAVDGDVAPVVSHAVRLSDAGVLQRVALPPSLTAALGTNYTAELWFYWDGSTTGNARFFSLLSDTSRMAFLLHVTDESLDAIVDNGEIESRTQTACSTAIARNEWHHAAMVVGTASVDIYLDGELSCSEPIVTPLLAPPSEGMSVGARDDGYIPDSFFGVVDEIRFSIGSIYSESFSPERRLAVTPATLGLWHVDEADGVALEDETGRSGDAWLEGGCLVDQGFEALPSCP